MMGESPAPTVVVVDTDTASDDAVALAMAFRHPGVHVAGITTVAGNCPVGQATSNALFTAELCGADVPVFAGAERPLHVEPQFATWFHGNDGLGDLGFAPASSEPEELHGVDALIELVDTNPGCVLVTLGPLTNLALALRRRPDLVDSIGRCVVMGGTANSVGNITPAAEFNLWFDPHAAAEVFAAGLPLELAPWDLCRGDAGLDAAEQARLQALGTAIGSFFIDCNAKALEAITRQSGSTRLELPDPTAMAIALEPDSVVDRASRHHVAVEAESSLTRGMAVVDSLDVTDHEANTEVVWEIDVARFKQLVFDAAAPATA